MKLLELVGVGEAGNIWRHQLPDKATFAYHKDRILVVSPCSLYWVNSEGQTEQATSYPRGARLHQDNGN